MINLSTLLMCCLICGGIGFLLGGVICVHVFIRAYEKQKAKLGQG